MMWWMLAGCTLTGLIGLEARRVLRTRIEEATGPRYYGLYTAGDPERAVRVVAIGDDESESGLLASRAALPGDEAVRGTTTHSGVADWNGLPQPHLHRHRRSIRA